jgi:hypothetical protein
MEYICSNSELVLVNGNYMELQRNRIKRSTIPKGKYMYEIRGNLADKPLTIEPVVFVDFYGTLITKDELDLGDDNFLNIKTFKHEGRVR